MKTRIRRGVGLGLLFAALMALAVAGVAGLKPAAKAVPQGNKNTGRAPALPKPSLRFVENRGQWDSRAKFLGQGPGIDTWVTETGVRFDLYKLRKGANSAFQSGPRSIPRFYRSGHVVEMQFEGGRPASSVDGVGDLLGRSNYLIGQNPVSGAKQFEETRLRNVYPGVDTRLYFESGQPRYDVIVAPGVDPSTVRLRFNGAQQVQQRSGTELNLRTSMGTMRIAGLYAYQLIGLRKVQVPATFSVAGNGSVGFNLGAYDNRYALVIDPIVYSSYLGGTGSVDVGNAVAVDRHNNGYVAGFCTATTFPTSIGAYDEQVVFVDGFVSKFTTDGTDLVYSTYVGGTTVSADAATAGTGPENFINGIAVDFDGNAYVVGSTAANDFDVNVGPGYTGAPAAPNRTFDDFYNAFVMKLAPDGASRIWARYLGGSRFDMANAIALGADNTVYLCGNTQSADFPTASPFQAAMKGDGDGFVTKLSADGATIVYSSYAGGTDTINPDDPLDNVEDPVNPFDNRNTHADDDVAVSIKVDSDGFAYVLVGTAFNDAPKVAGSFDTVVNGLDCLVLKVAQSGASLTWGTFVGGNVSETPAALALDSTNNVYITGNTNSFNYPRTTGAFDRVYNLGIDCFLTKLNRLGTGLIYSSFLGMTNGGRPTSLAVDDLGFAHVGGWISQSTNTVAWLPVTANADDATYNGPNDNTLSAGDGFLLVMNDTGTGLQYCSYVGGAATDQVLGVALDGPRNAYLTGNTNSDSNFPVTEGAFKTNMVPLDGGLVTLPDAFLSKIKTRIPLTITSLTLNPTLVAGGEQSTGTVSISAPASDSGALVSITNDNNSVVTTPVSVTIPAGATSATFTIDTNPNIIVRATVKVTATVEGDSKFANLVVTPWLEAFTLSNTTVVGGNPVAARVDLAFNAPTGGKTINLSSTVPAVATVPTTITIPAGSKTAVFDVTTLGVNSLQTVDLNASLQGLTITQQLDVIPATLLAISVNPARVSGGTPSAGVVQLNGSAPPGGVTVTLASDDPAAAVPATVFIPQQTQSVGFDVTTTVVNVNTTANLSATLGADTVKTTIDVLVANLISVAVTPDSIQGGNTATGVVGLDQPAASGGVIITLSTDNPAVATVPATVTIPSGATNANFVVSTVVVDTTVNVTIFADRDGAGPIVPLSANLEVRETLFTLTVDPDSVAGGNNAQGTIVLAEPAPAAGVTITLSTDDPAAQVPATVTITEGNDTVSFPIQTSAVGSDTVVTISGGFLLSSASDTLTVLAATPLSLDISPSVVIGGEDATGTVTLSGPAGPGGVVVTLSSDNAAASVPATVTVPQGADSASFTVSTTGVLTDQTATVTATVGAVSVQATVTVTATQIASIKFVPSRVRGGANTAMTVTLDSAAPPGGAVVSLSSSDPSLATIPATVTVLAGETSRTVLVPTRRVSRNLATQVSATFGGQTVFAVLTVTR